MFLSVFIFVVMLLLTLGVILLLTKPSTVERAIAGRLEKLSAAMNELPIANHDADDIIKHTKLSANPKFDALLRRFTVAQQVQLLVEQAHSSMSAGGVLSASLLLGVLGCAVGYYSLPNALAAFLPAIAFAAAPFLLLRFRRAQHLKAFNRYLPEVVDLMGRALRAGHSVAAAIEIVGEESPEPVRTEFREVYRQQNFGLPAREALVQMARRVPSPELKFVVTAMLLQKETGGNLVEVLERTAATIRERLRIQGEIRTYTAQGRMTGWILSLLPVTMFFLLGIVNHGYTRVLIEDAVGKKLVLTGVVLMILGGLTIRKIVRVKV